MWAVAILLSLVVGCGARTGLGEPERPAIDAAVADAFRPDGGPPDAPLPDGPRCARDEDCADALSCTDDRCVRGVCVLEPHDERCDDGRFCNGEERCVIGAGCAATAPACGDAVACTVDRCDDALAACVHEPDPSRCPISHRCDPVRGCVARALAHDPTTLYEIDLPSGELHVLGPTGVTLTDLALHPDGTLYGAVPGALVRVDYVAMLVEDVVAIDGAFNALDVAPDGTLYGATDDRVVRFDVVRGTATTVARFPMGLPTSGDLAFVDGVLYGTARTRFDDLLVRFDLVAGTSRSVGRVGHECVWGLAPFGDTLYGLTCEGKLLEIDVASGRGSLLRDGVTEFYGAGAR